MKVCHQGPARGGRGRLPPRPGEAPGARRGAGCTRTTDSHLKGTRQAEGGKKEEKGQHGMRLKGAGGGDQKGLCQSSLFVPGCGPNRTGAANETHHVPHARYAAEQG